MSQAALLGGAIALARAVSCPMILLEVAVLIAIPGDYGADRIFTCIEPFLTPRMAAEALTLGGLAAALSSRFVWAGILMLAAVLIHPVMAAAGLAALLFLQVGFARPRLALSLAVGGLAVIVVQALVMPTGTWGRFDIAWLDLIRHRSPYLFLAHWQLDDWSRAAVTLATLAAGMGVLPSITARTLARITLATVVSGFLLTVIACDGLRLVLFTQLQPWRWQWLGTIVAALLLPGVIRALWSKQAAGRASALMLIAAWVFATDFYALAAAGAALLSMQFLHCLRPAESRWLVWGAWGFLLVAVTWRVATNLQFTESYYLEPSIPQALRRTVSFVRDGTGPVAVIALMGWLSYRLKNAPLMAVCVIASVGTAALVPQMARTWVARDYPNFQIDRFAVFREKIPKGSDVFWPSSPVAAWLLLERPSYLSVIQTSGMVFSRRSAFELDRRANALSSIIAPGTFMSWSNAGTGFELSKDQLSRACATEEFEFMVTTAKLDAEPVAVVPPGSGQASGRNTYLYRCRAPSILREQRDARPQTLAAAAST